MPDTETLTTPGGMAFVRTPEERFAAIDDYPYDPRYATVDGLRMAYITAGPDEPGGGTATILLLHGEPTWGYLYRKMIPVLAGAGHRVMVPDLIGFGRSDKPVNRSAYTYAGHVGWMRGFLEATAAARGDGPLILFGQDWGGLIGLRLAAEHPVRDPANTALDRLILANTGLPCRWATPPAPASTSGWSQFSQDVPFLAPGHFIQEDQGPALAEAIVAWLAEDWSIVERHRDGVGRGDRGGLPGAVPGRAAPGRRPPVPAAGAGEARRSGRARQPRRMEGPGAVDQACAHPLGARRPGAGRHAVQLCRPDPRGRRW